MSKLSKKIEGALEAYKGFKKDTSDYIMLGGYASFIEDWMKQETLGIDGKMLFKSFSFVRWDVHQYKQIKNQRSCLILSLDKVADSLPFDSVYSDFFTAYSSSSVKPNVEISCFELDMQTIKEGNFNEIYSLLNYYQNKVFLETDGNESGVVSNNAHILIRNGDQFYPIYSFNVYRHLMPEKTLDVLSTVYSNYLSSTQILAQEDNNVERDLNLVDSRYNKDYFPWYGKVCDVPNNLRVFSERFSNVSFDIYSKRNVNYIYLNRPIISNITASFHNSDFFWDNIGYVSDNQMKDNFIYYVGAALKDKSPQTFNLRKDFIKKIWDSSKSLDFDREVLAKFIIAKSNAENEALYKDWAVDLFSEVKSNSMTIKCNKNNWEVDLNLMHWAFDFGVVHLPEFDPSFILKPNDVNEVQRSCELEIFRKSWIENLLSFTGGVLNYVNKACLDGKQGMTAQIHEIGPFDESSNQHEQNIKLIIKGAGEFSDKSQEPLLSSNQIKRIVNVCTTMFFRLAWTRDLKDLAVDFNQLSDFDKNNLEHSKISLAETFSVDIRKKLLENIVNNNEEDKDSQTDVNVKMGGFKL